MADTRRARTYLSVLCGLAALAVTACSGAQAKLAIATGGLDYARGDHIRASAHFLNALETASVKPYAEFALAAAYLALDEEAAALTHLQNAQEAAAQSAGKKEDSKLLYRIYYNTGIIYFQQADYKAAAEEFKRALTVAPARAEAKHNLELCYLSLQRQRDTAAVQTSRRGGISENKNQKRSGVLLDFMRQSETTHWKSFEWGGDDDTTTPDY